MLQHLLIKEKILRLNAKRQSSSSSAYKCQRAVAGAQSHDSLLPPLRPSGLKMFRDDLGLRPFLFYFFKDQKGFGRLEWNGETSFTTELPQKQKRQAGDFEPRHSSQGCKYDDAGAASLMGLARWLIYKKDSDLYYLIDFKWASFLATGEHKKISLVLIVISLSSHVC